jgi:N-acetylmuramoyl-L-alanine amidase
MNKKFWCCGAALIIASNLVAKSVQAIDTSVLLGVDPRRGDTYDTGIAGISKSLSNQHITYSAEDLEVLERIVEAEATGCSLESKMNIASVVINRVNSDEFPDNVKDVVFQKIAGHYQFSPVDDERYWEVEITQSTREAVMNVVAEGTTNDALYFCVYSDVQSEKLRDWFNGLNFLFEDNENIYYYN